MEKHCQNMFADTIWGGYYEIDSKNCLIDIEYYVKGKKVRTYEEKILT